MGLTNKQEVELPMQLLQCSRADLRPKCRNKPIPNTSCKSVSSRTNLHRHDLAHIHPRDRTKTEREYHRHTEEEEDPGNGEAVVFGRGEIVSFGVLGDLTVDYRFADQGERDTDCSPEKRLAAADPIEEEDDED